MTRVLDARLFDDVMREAADGGLAAFARGLRRHLRDTASEPFPGLDLQTSLECVMRVARMHHEVLLPGLATLADGAEGDAADLDDQPAHDRLRVAERLTSELLNLAIWLRTTGAPTWLLARLGARNVFRAHAQAAMHASAFRVALHWSTPVLLLPTTVLVDIDAPELPARVDVERLMALRRMNATGAVNEEIEAWAEIFSSYRLFR